MNQYKKGINKENKKDNVTQESLQSQTDEKKWNEFVRKYSHSGYVINSEFGIIDTSDDAMKDVFNGETLTYEEYLQALFNSRKNIRKSFEYCYYSNAMCSFKGKIIRFNRKKGKVIFDRIYVSGIFLDGDGYEGKEDHVWIDIGPFEKFKEGDSLSFSGEIYRYLKTGSGKQISYGIRKPCNIEMINPYKLPTDDNMLMQFAEQLVCESCMYNEQCYMGFCMVNEKWREVMMQNIVEYMKKKQI